MGFIKNLLLQPFCFFLFVVAGFIFSSANTFAAVPPTDTVYKNKSHKISKKEFLGQFGHDDSSRAFINYYFSERKSYRNKLLIYGAATTLSGVLFDNLITNGSPGSTDMLFGFLLGLGIFVYGLKWLFNGCRLIITSRKKLYKALSNYKYGKSLTSKIVKKKGFKKALIKEQNSQR